LKQCESLRSKLRQLLPDIEIPGAGFEPNLSKPKSPMELLITLMPTREEAAMALRSIAVTCRTIANIVEWHLGPPLSSEERDRLASLRAQIKELMDFKPNLYKHLIYAIDEYEGGHYLASSLIAGKVVQYIYEQLRNKLGASYDVEQIAKQMTEILGLKGKDKDKHLRELIETSKLARNYFTHDINAIPEPQEALRLLSGACDLALKYRDVTEKLRSQNIP